MNASDHLPPIKKRDEKTLKFLLLFFSFVHLKPINHESEKCLSLPRKKRNVSKMLAGWLLLQTDDGAATFVPTEIVRGTNHRTMKTLVSWHTYVLV